jgi:DNA-binding transcriptional ArsR family regulator
VEQLAGMSVLGTVRRTEVLQTIALLEETYAREIARLIDAPLLSVQRIVDALERDEIVVTRRIGVERRVALNPRFYAIAELKALLLRLSDRNERLIAAVSALRRRPRKKNKAL